MHISLSPDNKYAVAHTNNSLSVLLNMLTSEFFKIENPLENGEIVINALLSDSNCFILGACSWVVFSLRGEMLKNVRSTWSSPILLMEFKTEDNQCAITWTGNPDDQRMVLHYVDKEDDISLSFHDVMCWGKTKDKVYCCTEIDNHDVMLHALQKKSWVLVKKIASNTSVLLQLFLDHEYLIGTYMAGFKAWNLAGEKFQEHNLLLPHGVRNISTSPLSSSTCAMSKDLKYIVAGVRKTLYVWSAETEQLVKSLDAHFGRIIGMAPLTVGDSNCVVTTSLDRSVKVWNINNIFEQVHAMDRHELPVEKISLAHTKSLGVAVTRNSIGLWNTKLGKLVGCLADSALGAIVTQAVLTKDAKYIVSTESNNILVWSVNARAPIFKTKQTNVTLLILIDNDKKFIAVSREGGDPSCLLITREVPKGHVLYELTYSFRIYKPPAVSSDGNFLILPSSEGMKVCGRLNANIEYMII